MQVNLNQFQELKETSNDVPSNRGYELRRDNDTTKNVQVSLIDHDSWDYVLLQ